PTEAKKKEALKWLSRDLETALLQFIRETKEGEALRCCFYEFHYAPVLEELKDAIDRGVDVKIIIDAKENGSGKDPFPRNANFDTIKKAKIPKANVIQREAKKNDIQHNKFMVRLTGKKRTPVEVWTGSTNISLGGIHGQTNVGHWLRNRDVAERFLAYWTLLSDDPGARAGDDRAESKTKNDALKKSVEDLFDVPSTLKEIPKGVTPVFSPRSGLTVLDLYFDLVDAASASACITLAFGVSAALKDKLVKHTSESAIAFLLLEKKDEEKSNAKSPFVALRASNNVYSAWGSFLRDPVYQWAKETNARELALNNHVSYIHSKFLLRDPLGKDPIVVTGSANFSNASTNNNDENMLIIRGDHRVADIYFTEFNRLFNHYYFRAVHESTKQTITAAAASLFLAENDEWQAKYAPGKLRAKRLQLYTNMTGFTT
ncbi:MAG TPA: phospholipase D-like domain-containing protein, partial [Thermoanaerobaculia bacterium]|nr:phospholipase D-like domain-containing protein [Thermoanaerobaculia bacterium]